MYFTEGCLDLADHSVELPDLAGELLGVAELGVLLVGLHHLLHRGKLLLLLGQVPLRDLHGRVFRFPNGLIGSIAI